jgi:hypothetical protein
MVLLSPRLLYTLSSASCAKPYGTSPHPFFSFLAALSLLATYQQRAPPARHNREESILQGATDRRDLLVLPLQFPFPSGFWFQLSFELWDLQRLFFQDLLASLARVASAGGEINRSPQSCIHLNCRVMCALPEAPHRFVDYSGLRQATCGHGWSNRLDESLRHQTLSTMPTPYSLPEVLFFSCCKTQKPKLVHSF